MGSIIRYDFSGDMFLPILLNSIVHVLMYSHYLVTALGIKVRGCHLPYLNQLADSVSHVACRCVGWKFGAVAVCAAALA